MASMKDIKLRIKSVESTMQITKAMQLVAASKLRRARERMEASQPFLKLATDTMNAVAAGMDGKGPYFAPKTDKRLYVIVAGDRGLAGGYNSNVFKLVAEHAEGNPFRVLPIGKKALERYSRNPGCVVSDAYPVAEVVTVGNAFHMAETVLDGYNKGEFGQVYLVYTRFDSMLTQTASLTQLLPLTVPQKGEVNVGQVLVEQEPEEILKAVLPNVVAGSIFSAVRASFASEQAARRAAMDSATKNAGDMIEDLSLKYNRARQGAITQELTEIVAGAEH